VLVREVTEGSAAAKAGIKAGDVITRINSEAVVDVEDLRRALGQVEKEATITFVRDRKEQTVKVELEQQPARRSPRRSAGVIELDTETLQRYAEEMARQVEKQAGDIEAQVKQQIELKVQSKEFKQQMKDMKRKMKEIETRLQVI
jgi:membrane-associated protease RseP (regulator of RpoE activity)